MFSKKIIASFIFALVGLAAAPHASAASYTASQTGSWNVSTTWGGAGVPVAGDAVTIGAFTVTLTQAQACASVTFSGAGTITGAFTLSVTSSITANASATISTAQIDLGGNAVTLSSGASAANVLSISAVVATSTGTGSVTVGGSGVVGLSGANTYNGTTTVNAGATLSVSNASALGATTAGTTVATGGVLDMNGAALGAEPITVSGTGISSAGAITGTGTGSCSGAITMAAASSIGGGGSLTLSGVVSGAFALTKVGGGTITLSGANTYSGSTTVSVGTLSIANASGLGSTTGVSVSSGAALDINGVAVGAVPVTINGTGVSSAGALTGTGTGSLSGAVTLASASSIGGGGTLTLSGVVSGAFALTAVGSGVITLSGVNTYSGATTVSTGTLSVANASGLGSTTGVSVTAGATLDVNGVAVGAIGVTINGNGVGSGGALTGTGTGSLAGAVTLGSASSIGGAGALTLSAAVGGGTNALSKVGSGTLIMSGNNTYTGATTLSAGSLLMNGTSTASAITLVGGTLGGTGTVGAVTSSSTATVPVIQPGTATTKGLLTVGAVDLSKGSSPTVSVRIVATTTAGTDFDRLALGTATLTLGNESTLIVDVGGFTGSVGVDVITAGTVTGTFGTVKVINGAATVSYASNKVTVTPSMDTLIAEYKCDASSGTTLTDTSGNGFDGTFSANDFSWDPTGGWDSGALKCNGTGWVTLPLSADLQPSCVGVSFWAKRTGGTWRRKANTFLQTKGSGWQEPSGFYLEMYDVNLDQSLSIFVDGDNASSGRGWRYQNQPPDQLFPLGQWVHLFYVFNSITHTGAIYRNGVEVGSGAWNSPSTITKNTDPRLLGFCTGELDLFRIYANPSTAMVSTMANEKRKVWSGGGADNNWSTPGNWANNVQPSAGDNLVFSGSTRLTPNNDYVAGTAFRSITVTATGFTLGGNSVTLTNGILLDNGGGSATVNLPVTLAQAQPFTASAGTTLTIGGTVADGGYPLTLSGEGTITVNGVVSGTGGLATGLGSGSCELTALNTYSGTTTCNSGILRASSTVQASTNGAFGNAASAIILAGGTLQVNTATFSRAITASGGTLDAYGSARTVSSAITASSTLSVGANTVASAAGQALTLSGVISGAGGVTKVGTSTAILTGANTYSGATTVSAGTLQCGAAATLPLVATSVASGATLDCNGFNQTAGTLTGAGSVTLGVATLTCGGDNADGKFSGVISGTGGFAKTGTGSWTLSGTNTFTGAAAINAGTLVVANNAALGTVAGATTVAAGATLRFDSSYDIGAEPLTLSGSGVGGVGALYSSPTGAAVCSGAITLSGATRVGVGGWSLWLKGAIGGTGSLEKTGSGLLLLTAANGFSGATTVSAGSILIDGDTGTLASSSGITVGNGATLGIGGTGDVTWFEDALPTGAVPTGVNDAWTWVSASPAPYAGTLAHQSSIFTGAHQHYFTSATQTMPVSAGDVLFTYVYLDPANTPTEVMFQWEDASGSWEHRAFWGADAINWGAGSQPAHYPAGALPATGTWVRLSVPASLVNLEGATVIGTAFSLNDGRCTFDHTGRSPGASGTGAANPDRIGDAAAITLNGGSLTLAAPANVARSETFGQLVIGPGLDAITASASGTGSATLTASGNVSRSAGAGTLGFTRGTASPYGSLFFTGTTDLTTLPWTTVTQATTTMGQYTTANGLVQTASGTTYTSVATGNWNTNATWSPNTGHPTSADDMIVATGHKIHSDTGGNAVRNITFNDIGQMDQTKPTVNGVIRFLGPSVSQTWVGVDLEFNANEAVFDHENAAGSVYFVNSQSLHGTNGLTKTGPGIFDFQGTGNYTGPTTIAQGTFIASNATALGDATTGTTVQSVGLLKINAVTIASEPLTISGAGANGDGTLRGYAVCAYGGPITLAADSTIGTDTQAVFTLTGAIGGGFALTTNNSGTLVLSDASTYTGATALGGSGTVRLSADVIASANGPFGNATSAVTINGSAIEVNTPTVSRAFAATSLGGRIDAYGAVRAVAASISGSLTSGLTATFFNGSFRAITEDDWRLDQVIGGARIMQTINAHDNSWSSDSDRQTWGIAISGIQWQYFSVQWDGWITVHNTCDVWTSSDDGSRVWIDINGDGVVQSSEWGSNGWGNGHGNTSWKVASSVPPGTYRIRMQYEQGNGGDDMTLMWTDSTNSAGLYDKTNNGYIIPATCLTTNAAISLGGFPSPPIPSGAPGTGLIGCYFPQGLRNVTADDWRTLYTAGGTRLDAPISFTSTTFGTNAERLAFGIGGADQAWTNFSVQWDGLLTVPVNGEVVETASDDNTRIWIDGNRNGIVDAGEWTSNDWGNGGGQAVALGGATAALNAGTYPIRVQYEQGGGQYEMRLLWNDSGRSAGTWTGTGGTGYIIPSTYLSTGSVGTATGQPLVMRGVISGALDLTKTSGSTATLSIADTYTGYTAVEGGTLVLGATNAIPSTSSVRLSSATTLNLNGFADTVGSIQGAGALMLTSARLTCGGDNSSTTCSGVVSGPGGGITKQGSGKLTLSGTNTYSGTTIVNAGTLEVDGAQGSSAVTVNAGTLQGTGTVGAITADGGSVAPGTSSAKGVLTGSAATLGAGAKLHVRIAGYTTAGTNYDRLALGSGVATVEGATLELDLSGLSGFGTASGVIACGSVSGTFASITILNNSGGYDARAVYTATSVDVVVTSSLIAWYKLDESSGLFVSDSSGNGHHGTINTGQTWSPYGGAINGSLALGSNASHVTVDSSTALQPAAVTISCWVKRTAASWSTRENVVFYAKFNDQWDANGWYLSLKGPGSNDIILVVDGPNFSPFIGAAIDTFYPQNTWVHIAASFDSSTHAYRYYKNGAYLGAPGASVGTPLTISSQASNKFIGQPSTAWGTSTLEGVDDIRIFSRVLSDTEVNQIFLEGRSTRTWTGLGGNANWSTAGNWVGGVAPNSGPTLTDDLVFPAGAAQPTNTNDIASGTFNSITFTGGGYTLSTTALTLSNGVVGATGANTLTVPLTLGANQTFSAASGATLTINGTIASGGNRLYIDGAGTSSYGGVFSGAGGITKTGSGTATLSAVNTFVGSTVVAEGELDLATGGSLSASSAVSVTGGTLGGTGTVSGSITGTGGTIRPGTSGTRGILHGGSTTLTNGGTVTIRVAALSTPGTDYDQLDLATASGTLTLNGTSTLVLDLSGLATVGRAANVITCSGTAVGTFANVQVINNPNRWIVDVDYSASGAVSITLLVRRFGSVGVGAPFGF